MHDMDFDYKVRSRAFSFLEVQVGLYGEVLPLQVLEKGFEFVGTRIPLVSPQGIFKPHILQLPLTIRTAPIIEGQSRPYDDGFEERGLLRYRYRGTDPNHADNAGLREVMHRGLPLI